jgi:Protein of unknown function (DUF1552)
MSDHPIRFPRDPAAFGISRRQWLRGASGVVTAAGASHLFGRAAFAQKGSPQRLVCWPMMNGAEAQHFFANPGNLAAMSTVTEPIKKWSSLVTFVKGVNVSGSVNHYAVRSTYSGANIANYESPDPSVKSVDQLIADNIAQTAATQVKSMHLGVIPADSINYYKRAGRSTFFFAPAPVDYEANPVTAFDRFFGGAGGGAATPAPSAADFTADSLNLLDAEMNELSERLGKDSSEIGKLGQHREALKVLRPSKTDLAPPMAVPLSGQLAAVEKLRPMLQGNAKDAYKHAYFSDIFDAQVDIMARALVSGQTRVATLQAGSADNNVLVPVDGRGYPHHNTSHGNQSTYAQVARWYFTKLARLAQALDVPDPLDPGGKTVLQNTVIVVIAECLPVSHSSNSVPTLLLGTAGGKIKPGFVNGSGITNKNVMAAVLKAFNVGTGHFGNPLAEVLA